MRIRDITYNSECSSPFGDCGRYLANRFDKNLISCIYYKFRGHIQ